jgi:uncharacterized protein DUF4189
MVTKIAAALGLAAVLAHPAIAARTTSKGPWGAIAYNSTSGAYGFAVDQASRRAAETEAFRQCGADCDVVKSFRNSCAAIAEAGRHYAWETGASREIAEMKARKKCGGADACKISVWACTRGR